MNLFIDEPFNCRMKTRLHSCCLSSMMFSMNEYRNRFFKYCILLFMNRCPHELIHDRMLIFIAGYLLSIFNAFIHLFIKQYIDKFNFEHIQTVFRENIHHSPHT
jgi:hypothetical protein